MIWGLAHVIAAAHVAGICDASDIAAPQSPGPWKWPMSEDAKRWVETGCVAPGAEVQIPNEFVWLGKPSDEQKPELERGFNRAEHDRFMRGLR